MEYADLHIHTTASDGMLSPKEVVEWAYKKRLKAIAITDHDTVDGIGEALFQANKLNIEIIPGIEFNSYYEDEEIHILGYFIDYKSQTLLEKLNKIKQDRYERIVKIVNKLSDIGIEITLDEVLRISKGAAIGRPHVARVLIEKGYVQNNKAAFDEYIGKDKVAYVERLRMKSEDVINIIKQLGGISVLAHPGLIENKSIIGDIIKQGIEGIEVYHTKHDYETIIHLLSIANSRKLLITGGSDCHGNFLNNEPIIGNIAFDYEYVNKLKQYKKTMEG